MLQWIFLTHSHVFHHFWEGTNLMQKWEIQIHFGMIHSDWRGHSHLYFHSYIFHREYLNQIIDVDIIVILCLDMWQSTLYLTFSVTTTLQIRIIVWVWVYTRSIFSTSFISTLAIACWTWIELHICLRCTGNKHSPFAPLWENTSLS